MIDPVLPGWEHGQFATGASRYRDHGKGRSEGPGIYVEIIPGTLEAPVLAILDTGAPWCIFDSSTGEAIQYGYHPVSGPLSLSTRLGTFRGYLYSVPVRLPVIAGETLNFDATVFVSPEWPGGSFIGYEGLLQKIRFAVDPGANLFYFGPL